MSLAADCITLQKASLILSFLQKQLQIRLIWLLLGTLNCQVSVLTPLVRARLVYPTEERSTTVFLNNSQVYLDIIFAIISQ